MPDSPQSPLPPAPPASNTPERTQEQASTTAPAAQTQPPLWIHVSQAGSWLLPRREARRRALLKLLDRLPGGKSQAGASVKRS